MDQICCCSPFELIERKTSADLKQIYFSFESHVFFSYILYNILNKSVNIEERSSTLFHSSPIEVQQLFRLQPEEPKLTHILRFLVMSETAEQSQFDKYLILQITTVPSLLCDLIVLIHFIRHWRKEMIESSHNHAFVYLILASCIQKSVDVPFLLYYLRWGISLLRNSAFCLAWCWIDYSLISCLLHILAWFSIERHLFVFHNQWMKKKLSLIIFHYLPLIICSIYAPSFYFIVIFFPSKCENIWIYSQMFCGGACYVYNDPTLSIFDWLFHYALPVLIIFLANILLFLRVVWQKLALGRPIDWRRQRWMILQLIYLSSLCIVLQSPATIVGVIQILWLPTFALDVQANYLFYITYFLYQFLPIVIMSSLPELHKDIRQVIRRLKRFAGHEPRVHPGVKTTGFVLQRDTTIATA